METEAFGQAEEADLVDRLRDQNAHLLSLIAEVDGQVAGHILFTRMWIRSGETRVSAVALAPLAVLPEYQRRGVGTALTNEGLRRLRGMQERIVLVVGHKEYYPRFGFSRESAERLSTPFPTDSFFALELVPGALDGIAGSVEYHSAFGL